MTEAAGQAAAADAAGATAPADGAAQVTTSPETLTGTQQLQEYIDKNVLGKPAASPAAPAAADGAGPAPESTASETPTPADAGKPTLTEQQKQAAKHLGYDDEEIAELTPKQAKRIERQSAAQRKLESQVGRLQQQLKGATTVPEDDEPAAGDEAGAADETPAGDADLEPLSIDDDEEAFNRKAKALSDEVKSLRAELAELRNEGQTGVVAEVATEVDKFFAGLPGDLFPEYGGKKFSDLPADSAERASAQKVVLTARRLMDTHEELGEEVAIGQCLEEALAVVAKDQYRKHIERPVREQLDRRDKGSVAKPSGTATLPRKAADPAAEGRQKLMEFAHSRGLVMHE